MELANFLSSGEIPEGLPGEIPRLTQMDEQDIVSPSQLPASEDITKVARRSKNFTVEEDEKLVCAWLYISIDPARSFWVRIHELFMETSNTDQPRTRKALDHRWSHIQEHVSKFCGCYDKIQVLRASGKTEQDKIAEANVLFIELHKKRFHLLHCWRLLRGHPKWNNCLSVMKTKAPVTTEPNSSVPATDTPMTNNSVNLDENTPSPGSDYMRRPSGKKAAKKRGRDETGDELRTSRRERVEKMNQMKEHFLSVEMEMVAIKKEKVRVQENEIQLRREQLEFEQQMRREQFELDQQIRRDELELEKQKAERENRKGFWNNIREEERIMNIDLAALGEITQAYYMQLQKDILQKRMDK